MSSPFAVSRRLVLALGLSLILILSTVTLLGAEPNGKAAWYRGSTHVHSFWSDGDEFPEMVADWYKSHGYQFLAMSDHNVLMRGDRWYDVHHKKRPIPDKVMEACRRRFGDAWVQTRQQGDKLQVRLKTLGEIRTKLEEPGRFLMIENEEISGKCGEAHVHACAINLAEEIPFQAKANVLDTLQWDLATVGGQARRLGRPILTQVNHPGWPDYPVAPEDVAQATEARFFEVCNASMGANHYGDADHPGDERFWDIANTIRLAQLKTAPLAGIASDDVHHYQVFKPENANPGRGWVMVRAQELSTAAILAAMNRGEFYATTGVTLRELTYDAQKGTLQVEVQGEPGVHYTIEFIGTPTDYDRQGKLVSLPDKKGKPQRPVQKYSADVGKVLAKVEGTTATYQLTGKELYVRAVIRSDKPIANPPKNEVQNEEAWCPPVGWEKWVRL